MGLVLRSGDTFILNKHTWKSVCNFCPSEQDRRVGVETHALVHTASQVLKPGIPGHIRLVCIPQNLINLILGLQCEQEILLKYAQFHCKRLSLALLM